MEFIALENDVVKLKPLELNDLPGIIEAGRYPEIWSHMSTTIKKKEDVNNFVENALITRSGKTEFPFVIVDKKSGDIIGSTRFMDIDDKHQRLEIGNTWLTPAYWRTAINTNCKYLLLQYCFEQLHLKRVQIKTDHENIRSQKAIERIGATKEGILRNHMIRKDGTTRHTVMYSITIEEWSKVKKHLEELLVQFGYN
ncbi:MULTISPECIES: GNAT family N-acetyltransferase [Lysinibacillus]|uniref:GNAT family N-acetyltransferase n=1 Tax=Lysinibacillus TaxID=400634 RepID=UPI0007385284|nr:MULTISPECIES: GNAT family protein [unclassified Lysinibacillus]MEE3807835.1 GNAT family protein [Lysinibacillus fusiformis]KUF35016.1 GNAT family acetyltransferase [Lysinibacillus sp. F5]SCY55572.1 Protein N-acetyltransferase, RimJ/RimL family [Lysinibacillus sp. SG9]SDB23811.1 Protein N-acetyltransferase, RimJ/RimL family [Lysinibacillus sp. TC-37]SFS69531.1 Protein N-acetyltransferase, RimJ/RimL family [Lysinibacillus sp. SG55]